LTERLLPLALVSIACFALLATTEINAQTTTDAPAPVATSIAPDAAATVIPTTAPGVVLPGGTTVTVSLQEPLSSANAEVDDQIAIIVKKPVIIDGLLFIAEGANGHATVTSATHSGGNGSGGKLAISIDWVVAADGGKIKLSQTNHASETGDQKGASSTATIASYLLLGPLGLFAHNFVHGKDVTISPKQNFVVFVDHDVRMIVKPPAPSVESTPR
jgi:hypothetical protein